MRGSEAGLQNRRNADAEGFFCGTCDCQYQFVLCASCDSVNQVPASARRAVCDWCLTEIRVRAFGRKDTATAADWRAELDERGYLHEFGVLVGGFTLVGGSGFDLETGAICSVLTLPDAVDIRAEVFGVGIATIPYARLTGIDIAGGAITRGGGFIGGGFGVAGAAEGMLVASLLNSLTRRTTIDLAIASIDGELLLNHSVIPPDELRRRLSVLFTRFNAARHNQAGAAQPSAQDPVSQLERLAELHAKGLLTPDEFEAARRVQVRRLTEEA